MTNGSSLMISAFICPCHGIFATEELGSSYELFKAGANRDGYWDNEMLVNQFENVIPLFEKLHPGKIGLFCFDHSQNHQAQADDALVATRMNLRDGSKAKKKYLMRPTMLGPQNTEQYMVFIDQNNQLQPKGAQRVLSERNLWRHGMVMDCKEGCPGNGVVDCCARTLLANQPDFLAQAQTCCIKEVGEREHTSYDENNIPYQTKHIVECFPQFHCELNPIELFWGWLKSESRKRCTYSFADLQTIVPQLIEESRNNVHMIRRHARRCLRYMDAYRTDVSLVGPLLEYAMKKYSSHRRLPPDFAVETLMREYEESRRSKQPQLNPFFRFLCIQSGRKLGKACLHVSQFLFVS